MTTQTQARPRVGEYFCTSWGYDQTNIDYLVVVGVSPSGKSVKCRMAQGMIIDATRTSEGLTPSTAYGDEFRMQVRICDGRMYLAGSYPFVDGRMAYGKRSDHFRQTELGSVQYQTRPEFGH